ncbi:HlyD family efflux transporter periplasmic adaptor subunit [Cypionkella sp. TWP1-2-1b2]|uniref:HlyD family efflux transporter periplasmic adaptor subunit n=1 Tax=Cypionkella sp. TWP1-2-1b2 TaxID=2804675 RepID=UPI003CFB2A4D
MMKVARLILGIVICLTAIWIIVGEQVSGASADAVVNAQLSTLRTSIAGSVALQQRALGSSVVKDEELGSVTDPLVDTVRLNDLVMERDVAQSDMDKLVSMITATDSTIAKLTQRAKTYSMERIADLELRLFSARARFSLLSDRAEQGLLVSAFSEGDGQQFDARVPELALNYAAEKVAALEIAVRAARSGVYLGDGYNDSPNSEQRVVELQTTLDGLKSDVIAAAGRKLAIERRIKFEQLRSSRLQTVTLKATVNGILWDYLTSDAETVQRGQDVMRFVDCDSAVVTASVAENVYRRLSAGQSATFRMSGDSVILPATVTRLAGPGAQAIYGNLAVAPSKQHLERFDVTLLVPALRDKQDLRCAIGRTGRVFFDTRPLDWLRGFWR